MMGEKSSNGGYGQVSYALDAEVMHAAGAVSICSVEAGLINLAVGGGICD